ncbi:MAG: hypothetical protein RMK01_08095 [Thermomicrobium sp.]|nr:hypothetical protein [Thermomicrobium sp.]
MELLFSRPFYEELERRIQKAKNQVHDTIQAPSDIDEETLLQQLVDRYTPKVPVVHWDKGTWQARDADIYTQTPGGVQTKMPGTEYVWRVPYEGDQNLFAFQPSSYTLNPPKAKVEKGFLVFRYQFVVTTPEDELKRLLQQYKQATIKDVDQYLRWMQEDVEKFRERLQNELSNVIRRRKEELLRRQRVLESLSEDEGTNATTSRS